MAWRFSKRIKILPGVTINASKSGLSASIGPKGSKLNIGKRGVRHTMSIPGTGLSHSQKISGTKSRTPAGSGNQGCGCLTWIVIAVFVLFVMALIGSHSSNTTRNTATAHPAELRGTIEQNGDASTEIFKEKKVKGIWRMNDDYYVGVRDDGTRRDGYAMYLCEILREHGVEANVKVVNYRKVVRNSKARPKSFKMAGHSVYESAILGQYQCRLKG